MSLTLYDLVRIILRASGFLGKLHLGGGMGTACRQFSSIYMKTVSGGGPGLTISGHTAPEQGSYSPLACQEPVQKPSLGGEPSEASGEGTEWAFLGTRETRAWCHFLNNGFRSLEPPMTATS